MARLVYGVCVSGVPGTSEVQGWYFYKCQFYFWFKGSGTNLQKNKLDIHKWVQCLTHLQNSLSKHWRILIICGFRGFKIRVLIASLGCDLTAVQPFLMSCQLLPDSYILCTQSHGYRLLIRTNPACIFSWEKVYRKISRGPIIQGSNQRFQGRHVPQDLEESVSRALAECNQTILKQLFSSCVRATNFGHTPRKKKKKKTEMAPFTNVPVQHTVTSFFLLEDGRRAMNESSSLSK